MEARAVRELLRVTCATRLEQRGEHRHGRVSRREPLRLRRGSAQCYIKTVGFATDK